MINVDRRDFSARSPIITRRKRTAQDQRTPTESSIHTADSREYGKHKHKPVPHSDASIYIIHIRAIIKSPYFRDSNRDDVNRSSGSVCHRLENSPNFLNSYAANTFFFNVRTAVLVAISLYIYICIVDVAPRNYELSTVSHYRLSTLYRAGNRALEKFVVM